MKFQKKLEIGGMATVYKAKCHVLNRYVAVKVLKEEFTTDKGVEELINKNIKKTEVLKDD